MKKKASTAANPRFQSDVKVGLSRAERKDLGKAARKNAPLSAHGNLHLRKTERDIICILEKSNEGRIKDLIPLRYGRMLASPFTFFRGTAAIMAMDLADTPSSGFRVQVCGDCHIQNFGAFATPERQIAIDINDFDETLPAPWEWDVKRLAASLVLAATTNGHSVETGQDAVMRMARGYREHIAALTELPFLDSWYSHISIDRALTLSKGAARQRRRRLIEAARAKSSPEVMMEKLTVVSGGRVRFKDMPPLIQHIDSVSADIAEKEAFEEYCKTLPDFVRVLLDKFELVDIARKVVGVGSVGTMCGVLLLSSSEQDTLILQIKEARKSVLEPYAGASPYAHCGQRIVNGQRLMQAASDFFLGWTSGHRPPYRQFFIRQLHDVKVGVNTALWGKEEFRSITPLVGEILARAHCRSGDPSVLRGYLGKGAEFDEALALYGARYARQTEIDYHAFVQACKSGRLKAHKLD